MRKMDYFEMYYFEVEIMELDRTVGEESEESKMTVWTKQITVLTITTNNFISDIIVKMCLIRML